MDIFKDATNVDPTFWNIDIDSENGSHFRASGFPDNCCTGFAREIQLRLGCDRVKIYGWAEGENTYSMISYLFGGHDFAVVDDRWIVDPWLHHVNMGEFCTRKNNGCSIPTGGRAVFDLQDPQQKPLISGIYGDRKLWKENKEIRKLLVDKLLGELYVNRRNAKKAALASVCINAMPGASNINSEYGSFGTGVSHQDMDIMVERGMYPIRCDSNLGILREMPPLPPVINPFGDGDMVLITIDENGRHITIKEK